MTDRADAHELLADLERLLIDGGAEVLTDSLAEGVDEDAPAWKLAVEAGLPAEEVVEIDADAGRGEDVRPDLKVISNRLGALEDAIDEEPVEGAAEALEERKELREEVAELEGKVADLKHDRENLRERLNQREAEFEDLSEKLSESRQRVDELETTLANREETIGELERAVGFDGTDAGPVEDLVASLRELYDALVDAEDPLDKDDVAERLDISRSAAAKRVQKLRQQDLVESLEHPDDGRKYVYYPVAPEDDGDDTPADDEDDESEEPDAARIAREHDLDRNQIAAAIANAGVPLDVHKDLGISRDDAHALCEALGVYEHESGRVRADDSRARDVVAEHVPAAVADGGEDGGE